MKPLLVYLLLINALAFLLMLMDKQNAKKHRRRIPEATLLMVAFLGGSVGAIAGMDICRHKTKKPKFSVGLPVCLALHVVLAVLILL